jgi:hypothetical protein
MKYRTRMMSGACQQFSGKRGVLGDDPSGHRDGIRWDKLKLACENWLIEHGQPAQDEFERSLHTMRGTLL